MSMMKNVLLVLGVVFIFILPVNAAMKSPDYWEYKPASKINDVAVSDKGEIALALQDGTILVLDKEKTEKRKILLDSPAKAVGISADGSSIVAGSANILTKFDSGGNTVWSKKLDNAVNKISISDLNSIAVAAQCNKQNVINECNTTYLLDKDGALLWANLKTWGASDIDIAPKNEYLLVSYETKKSFLFDKAGKPLFEVQSSIITDGQMFDIAVFSGGNTAAGFEEGVRAINNYNDLEPRSSWFYRTDGKVAGIDSSDSGDYIVAIARRLEKIDYTLPRGGYNFKDCCAVYMIDGSGSLGWKQAVDYWASSVRISPSGRYAVAYSEETLSFFDNSANVAQLTTEPSPTAVPTPAATSSPTITPPPASLPPTTAPSPTQPPAATEPPEEKLPAATQPPVPEEGMDFRATIQFVATLLAIVGSLIGIASYHKSNKRRKKFFEYVVKIDNVYKSYRGNLQTAEAELHKIKTALVEDFRKGAVDEGNYITLEKKIGDYLADIRVKIINEKFGYLPPKLASLLAEIIHADNKITKEEYDRFMRVLSQSTELRYSEKKDIESVLSEWVEKDRTGA